MGNLVFEGSKNTEPVSRKGGRKQAIFSYHLGTAPHLMSHIKETKKNGVKNMNVFIGLCLSPLGWEKPWIFLFVHRRFRYI